MNTCSFDTFVIGIIFMEVQLSDVGSFLTFV